MYMLKVFCIVKYSHICWVHIYLTDMRVVSVLSYQEIINRYLYQNVRLQAKIQP